MSVWIPIVRLGLVQAAIGAMVMLATSLLNRVMVVELGLAAAIPAGLVAWHYLVQLTRPHWGHGSDRGRRRTPWIVGGMGLLALGALLAVDAAAIMTSAPVAGHMLAFLGYSLIGAGVGAAGTSLLALLASIVPPERRAAAAATTWIMMVAGIAVSAGMAGSLLDPFSMARLALVAGGVALSAFLLAAVAVYRLEGRAVTVSREAGSFGDALREIRSDPQASQFTLFVFVSMLAYSMQDLILEPFGGLVFRMSPGETTSLSGIQHGGVLAGMLLAGFGGSAFGGRTAHGLRPWTVGGCLLSGLMLGGLVLGAAAGPGWLLALNVVLLGGANGVFAVAAIGSMMALAGQGRVAGAGVRMGVWGAAQAIAFGLGGLLGAGAVDIARALTGSASLAFQIAFAAQAALFLLAAWIAVSMARPLHAPRAAIRT